MTKVTKVRVGVDRRDSRVITEPVEYELIVRLRVHAHAEHQAKMKVIAALKPVVEAMAFEEEYVGLVG